MRKPGSETKGGAHSMVNIRNEKGTISITSEVLTYLAGVAATSCFGVKGMAVRSMTDGLVHLLRREAMGKGVRVTLNDDNSISIDLHIMVDHGVNLAAVGEAIISEVRYVVHKQTGTEVKSVNVYVDSITTD